MILQPPTDRQLYGIRIPVKGALDFLRLYHNNFMILPGGVAFGSPRRHSFFSEHSNALFLDMAAGLIRYSGKNEDRMATSSSSSVGAFLGVLVLSVMLPNLLVITSIGMFALVLNRKRDTDQYNTDIDNLFATGNLPSPELIPAHPHTRNKPVDRTTF